MLNNIYKDFDYRLCTSKNMLREKVQNTEPTVFWTFLDFILIHFNPIFIYMYETIIIKILTALNVIDNPVVIRGLK